MTATDELRRLLDERGVEWRGGLPTETMVEADGLDLLYVALPDGRVRAFIRNYLTPEQAVEATLGNDGAAELQTENAKLRELCAGLWTVMWACAEQRCPHRHEDCFVVSGNGGGPKSHGECWYKQRMREMGVSAE